MEIDINKEPEEIEDDYPDLSNEENWRNFFAFLAIIVALVITYIIF